MSSFSTNGSSSPQSFTLIAATFTAFNADGSLNLAAIERQAELLVRQEVNGVFVCGTTGEGVSLTTDERMQVAARWCEVASDSLQVIVHVGHNSLAEARDLAAHAQRIKAAGVGAVSPSFFRPRDVSTLVDVCSSIAEAATDLPFYYYHIPVMTGIHLPMADFFELARARIPNFAGLKFTHEDLMDYARCLELAGEEYAIFFGRDEILLAALSLGARGAVGSTYNFAAPIFREVVAAFRAGDLDRARRVQAEARRMIELIVKYRGVAAQKTLMSWLGIDCGPLRLPLASLTSEEATSLRREMEQLGILDRLLA
ncbi:MAG: dihydrodipicolinate synthase family protein [Anaerolineae bacterium]